MTENEKIAIRKAVSAVRNVLAEVEQHASSVSSNGRELFYVAVEHSDYDDYVSFVKNELGRLITALDGLRLSADFGKKILAKCQSSINAAKEAE